MLASWDLIAYIYINNSNKDSGKGSLVRQSSEVPVFLCRGYFWWSEYAAIQKPQIDVRGLLAAIIEIN